jgi:hypothetical protein
VPPLFEKIVRRAQTEMPDWYLPAADGVLIAGEDMLCVAIRCPHLRLPDTGRTWGTFELLTSATAIACLSQCGNTLSLPP